MSLLYSTGSSTTEPSSMPVLYLTTDYRILKSSLKIILLCVEIIVWYNNEKLDLLLFSVFFFFSFNFCFKILTVSGTGTKAQRRVFICLGHHLKTLFIWSFRCPWVTELMPDCSQQLLLWVSRSYASEAELFFCLGDWFFCDYIIILAIVEESTCLTVLLLTPNKGSHGCVCLPYCERNSFRRPC